MKHLLSFVFSIALVTSACADEADELAKKLANPVAAMISLPMQFNADFGSGPVDQGGSVNLKIQPVIPITLSSSWNLISRTIMPLAGVSGLGSADAFGLGDFTQAFYFSPANPGPSGIIWGFGPSFLLPTASAASLGTGKWGAGPSGLVLKQTGPWTVGMLATHTWSFAGAADRADVSSTFLQPFMSYSLGNGRSVSLNTETSYDWVGGQWTVPINLGYSQVFKAGDQAMSWQLGLRYYATKPSGGPDWGLRAGLTFLFPEK